MKEMSGIGLEGWRVGGLEHNKIKINMEFVTEGKSEQG